MSETILSLFLLDAIFLDEFILKLKSISDINICKIESTSIYVPYFSTPKALVNMGIINSGTIKLIKCTTPLEKIFFFNSLTKFKNLTFCNYSDLK